MEDSLFRALADPTRRRILELLTEKDRTAGEIAEQFPMAFASVSHHLGVLRTPRWWDTDANAIGNCSAISPAVLSFSVSSSRIRRRVGSARARNRESSIGGRYLYKRLNMSSKVD